jgi:hypothetical protein
MAALPRFGSLLVGVFLEKTQNSRLFHSREVLEGRGIRQTPELRSTQHTSTGMEPHAPPNLCDQA